MHALSRVIFSLLVIAEEIFRKMYPELETKAKR